MKAFLETQEKKTGLRPIWKKLARGLVVLTLAALLFPACNSGDGDSPSDGGGGIGVSRTVVSMEVRTPPAEYSFEGLPVNLKGMEVVFRYSDNSTKIITDYTQFYTETKNPYRGSVNDSTGNTPVTPNTDPVNGRIPLWAQTVVDSNGDPIGLGSVPADYRFAEYGRLEYTLCYAHVNTPVPVRCDLRVRGVLSLQKVHVTGELKKKSYFIDDVIDYSGLWVELDYDTGIGRFWVDGVEVWGKKKDFNYQGTPHQERVPVYTEWDWSLNYKKAIKEYPFIRANCGNARATDGYYFRYDDYELDNLYLVKSLDVTVPPTVETEYFSNYKITQSTMKDEWFKTALKDTVITVSYYGTDETKKMVANPTGSELSLYSHMERWPILNGPKPAIYKNQYFVFTHQNAEKYLEINVDEGRPVSKSTGPVKVYILDPNEELVVTPEDLSWPILPLDKAGRVEDLLERITITGTWVYYDENGEQVGDSVPHIIPSDDPNITFEPRIGSDNRGVAPGDHEAPYLIDNVGNRSLGGGIYSRLWWTPAVYTPRNVTIRYTDYWNDFIPFPQYGGQQGESRYAGRFSL